MDIYTITNIASYLNLDTQLVMRRTCKTLHDVIQLDAEMCDDVAEIIALHGLDKSSSARFENIAHEKTFEDYMKGIITSVECNGMKNVVCCKCEKLFNVNRKCESKICKNCNKYSIIWNALEKTNPTSTIYQPLPFWFSRTDATPMITNKLKPIHFTQQCFYEKKSRKRK